MKTTHWIASLSLFGALLVSSPSFAHEEEFKNLKLLQDTGEDLERAMKHFTKGLGVKCKACHIKGKFESDEKAVKEKARTFFKTALSTKDQAARDAALATLLKELGRDAAKKPDRLWKGVGMLKLKSK